MPRVFRNILLRILLLFCILIGAPLGAPAATYVSQSGAEYKTQSVDDSAYFSKVDMMEVMDQMMESWSKTQDIRLEAEKDPKSAVSDGSSVSIFLSVRYPITRYVFYGAENTQALIEKLNDWEELAKAAAYNALMATCYKIYGDTMNDLGSGGGDSESPLTGPVSADWDCTKWDMKRINRTPTGQGVGKGNSDVAYMMGLLNGKAGYISSPWGSRTHPVNHKPNTFHAGIDIAMSVGTPIYSAMPGKVICENKSGYGNTVDIVYGKTMVRYAHLSKYGPKCGSTVQAGELIAYSGNSGRVQGKGHLHFEVQGCSNQKNTCDPIAFARKILQDYHKEHCADKPIGGSSISNTRMSLYTQSYTGATCKNCGNATLRAMEEEPVKPIRTNKLPDNVKWDPETSGKPVSGLPAKFPPFYVNTGGGPITKGKLRYTPSGNFVYLSDDGSIWQLNKDTNKWIGTIITDKGQLEAYYDTTKADPKIEFTDPLFSAPRGPDEPPAPIPELTSGDSSITMQDCADMVKGSHGNLALYAGALGIPTIERVKEFAKNIQESMKMLAEMLPGIDGKSTLYDITRMMGILLFICLSFVSIAMHQYYKLAGDQAMMHATGPVPFIYRFLFTIFLFIAFPDIIMSIMQISDLVRDLIAGGDNGNGYLKSLEHLHEVLDASIWMNAPYTEDGFIISWLKWLNYEHWALLFRAFLMRILFYLMLAAIYVINVSCDLLLGIACAIAPIVFPFCMLPRFGKEYWQGLVRTVCGFAMLGPVCALFIHIMVFIASIAGQLGVIAFILVGCTAVGVSSKLVSVAATMSTSTLKEGVGRIAGAPSMSAKGAGKAALQQIGNTIKKFF